MWTMAPVNMPANMPVNVLAMDGAEQQTLGRIAPRHLLGCADAEYQESASALNIRASEQIDATSNRRRQSMLAHGFGQPHVVVR